MSSIFPRTAPAEKHEIPTLHWDEIPCGGRRLAEHGFDLKSRIQNDELAFQVTVYLVVEVALELFRFKVLWRWDRESHWGYLVSSKPPMCEGERNYKRREQM